MQGYWVLLVGRCPTLNYMYSTCHPWRDPALVLRPEGKIVMPVLTGEVDQSG